MKRTTSRGPSPGLGVRHGQALVLFLGVIINYASRMNLSVASVAMTTPTGDNSTTVDWSLNKIGVLSSMVYYGYMVSNPSAGYLLNYLSPSKLLSGAALLCALANSLFPVFALHVGYAGTCVLRMLLGLGQGVALPATYAHLAKWAVPEEKGLMFSTVLSGVEMASMLMSSVGGYIADSSLGWPGIFYLSGVLGLVWGITGFIFLRDSPSVHTSISKTEKDWIESGLPAVFADIRKPPTPWRSILLSRLVWVGAVMSLCSQWGNITILSLGPTFLKKTKKISTTETGLLTALPYVASSIICLLSGPLSDLFIRKGYLSPLASRRMWNSFALYGSAIALLLLGTLTFGVVGAVTALTAANGLMGFRYSGYMLLAPDIAPNYSGIVFGIQNGISCLSLITAPTVDGLLVQDEYNASDWRIVFLISAGVFLFGNTFYIFSVSSEVQPWNDSLSKRKSLQYQKKIVLR